MVRASLAGPVACVLLLVAGFVDAIAFVFLNGNFVSFMSGNTTVLGAAPSRGLWSEAALCMTLIVLFFCGVLGGSVYNRRTRRSPVPMLGLVTLGLALAAVVAELGAGTAAMLIVTVAAGLINTVFERDHLRHGLTYVTGTLVSAARQLADAVTAEPGERNHRAWLASIGMWFLLALGAVAGGFAYRWIALGALYIPVALLAVALLAVGLLSGTINGPPDTGSVIT